MRIFGGTANTVHAGLTDGSIRAAWIRAAVVATVALTIVLTLQVATPRADQLPFQPTVTLETSTSLAAAHPDARITIENPGTEDLKSVQLDLPDGMWGSLAAVPGLCAWANAEAGTCPASTKVGTIVADATIDESDARLRGSVFITVPDPGSPDAGKGPAWLSIVLRAQVGGVDFGNVITPGRIELRHNQAGVPVSGSGPIYGPVIGLRTIVNDIPRTVTDDNSARTLSFHLEKMQIDLRSNQTAPELPLLTNSSTCGTSQVASVMTSYDSVTVGTPSDSYDVTGCSSLKVKPVSTEFDLASPNAESPTDLTTTIDFGTTTSNSRQPTLDSTEVLLPPQMSANFPDIGSSSNHCSPGSSNVRLPSNSSPSAQPFFRSPSITWTSSNCPAGAKIGTATVWTPLLPDPVSGDVWAISTSPLPHIGIDVNPSIPGNPAGVNLTIIGESSTGPAIDGQNTSIKLTFGALPDAPVSKIAVAINGAPVEGGDVDVTREMLVLAGSEDPTCQPDIDFGVRFGSHAGTAADNSTVDSDAVAGCNALPFSSTGPAGTTTNSNQPSFSVNNTYTYGECAFRPVPTQTVDCPLGMTSPVAPVTALADGLRAFHVAAADTDDVTNFPEDRRDVYRYFAVDTSTPNASTAPQTTIDDSPSDPTSDTTPTVDFSATGGPALFQCSLNGGAFLPCGSPGLATSGSYTVPGADALIPGDTTYSIAVRAISDVGKVGPADTATFKVNVPFGPTITVSSSTNVARAHPDLDITIDNRSHEDIKDVTVKLPDGLFGSLQGAQMLCGVAAADAGNCPAGSKVGTVEVEGVVDESVVRIDGEVFLTDPLQPGDAASLSIKVPAVIQDVNMGNIIVPSRMVVRGEAQGFDALVVQVPNSIDPAASGNTYDSETFFDMRKMTMKIRTNPGAAQPFLVNPSSCAAGTTFTASFTGYDNTTGSSIVPYPVSGCDALAFSPSLSASIKLPSGAPPNASDYQGVNLTATLNAQPDQAGIKKASILMPKPMTMDVSKLPPVCEKAQYLLDTCPDSTIIGNAVATSPALLPGEVLSGPVYLLRGDGTVMPRLYVRLSGRITVRFVGKTSFENETQLRTVFADLPDAPLSSFTMNVANLLSTMEKPCALGDRYGYSMTGTLTGQNEKTAGVDSPFVFDCAGIALNYKFTAKRKRSKLSFTLKTVGSQPKIKSVQIKFPKYVTMNKRALKRKLNVKVDGKRLNSKCFRYLKPDLLKLGLCGKRVSLIELRFQTGSLIVGKKLRKGAKLKITTVDVSKKTTRQSLSLFSKAFVSGFKLP